MLSIEPLSETAARQVLDWAYEPPYDLYNHRPEQAPETLRYLLDPENGFHAIREAHGELIAFCSFGPDAQVSGGDYSAEALDVGLGMRPDLTGRGRGPQVIGGALAFAAEKFSPVRFRATIAAFNLRARKAWAGAGFAETAEFARGSDGRKFVILVKEGKT
jgi:ribosomal-protein-alanine N-acetyltransferase